MPTYVYDRHTNRSFGVITGSSGARLRGEIEHDGEVDLLTLRDFEGNVVWTETKTWTSPDEFESEGVFDFNGEEGRVWFRNLPGNGLTRSARARMPYQSLLPIFVFFAIGIALRKARLAEREHATLLFRLVFFVTLPALAFQTISNSPLTSSAILLPFAGFTVNLTCMLAALTYLRKFGVVPAQAGGGRPRCQHHEHGVHVPVHHGRAGPRPPCRKPSSMTSATRSSWRPSPTWRRCASAQAMLRR